MSRFLLAAIALLAFPVLSQAQVQTQDESGTHTVVRGETLWDLSRTYFGDPFNWRTIHEANTEIVANPHWIYPGQILSIPGLPPRRAQTASSTDPSAVTDVMVQVASDRTASEESEADRTVFYRNEATRVLGSSLIASDETEFTAVPRDIFYSAGWLVPGREAPEHLATIRSFEHEAQVRPRMSRQIAQPFESLLIDFAGSDRPSVGERLLSFRVERTIDHGQVVVPSGMLTVHRTESGGAIAVVTAEYNRVQLGDFLVRLPDFPLEPGVHPADVTDELAATLLGFQMQRDLHGPGDVVFLDKGSAQGVQIGDEFTASVPAGDGFGGRIGGRLQVVRVKESGASARIIALDGPIFESGMVVSRAGRMP